jgi:hypothetical protein
MGQKMKILNFELEVNLDRHSDVKFDGESDGDIPEAQQPYLDLINDPLLTPHGPKNENFKL